MKGATSVVKFRDVVLNDLPLTELPDAVIESLVASGDDAAAEELIRRQTV